MSLLNTLVSDSWSVQINKTTLNSTKTASKIRCVQPVLYLLIARLVMQFKVSLEEQSNARKYVPLGVL